MTSNVSLDLSLHHAAIALGSNLSTELGEPSTLLNLAIAQLDAHPEIAVTARSSFYETPPIGPPQPNYINACILVATTVSAVTLLDILLETETQFGRVRQARWGARSLDLDLLLYDDLIWQSPNLQVPHPRLQERAFVLVPLAEIAAEWIDPRTGVAIAQLLHNVDVSDIVRRHCATR
jgi:2-amino-4-hydroxy-6-hydroxymethyldihydropteridine diphosphokinase